MSRTLSGLFLVGALNRLRKRNRTIRENPRTIPEQIRKIPEKSGKSQKGQKRTKKEGEVQIGKPPRLNPPRLAALDKDGKEPQIVSRKLCTIPFSYECTLDPGILSACEGQVCDGFWVFWVWRNSGFTEGPLPFGPILEGLP